MPDREPWSTRLKVDSVARKETVILVPPMGDPWWNGYSRAGTKMDQSLARGFELARPHVGKGRVRIVGRGATVDAFWPPWVAGAEDLILTEFDAYLPEARSALLEELVPAATRWLGDVLADASPGVDPAKAFWSSTLYRFLNPSFAAWPIVLGVAHHHGGDVVLCGEPEWAGCVALEEAIRSRGGGCTVVGRRPSLVPFAAKVAAQTAAWLLLGAGKRGAEFWRERGARRWMSTQRRPTPATPRIWLGINGSAPQACRHVVAGAAPAVPADADVGLLLHASLGGACSGPTPWPVLQEIKEATRGRIVSVDQCASVESWGEFGVALWRTLRTSARGAARVVGQGEDVRLGPMAVSLGSQSEHIARLLTLDVLRATEAHMATRKFLARQQTRSARVVWPHASSANVSVVDLLLRSAGAHTIDLVHGMLSDATMMVMSEQTFSTTKVLWTTAEASFCGPFAGAGVCEGGFVPRKLASKPSLRTAGPMRILVATNYLFETQREGPVAFECYQRALMAALIPVSRELGARVELRWRPHPSESASRVAAQLQREPGVFTSVSRQPGALQSELAWADIVVTAISSTIVEALCHRVVVIVHDTPVHDADGIKSSIRQQRRFRDAEELARILPAVVGRLERGEQDVYEPDDLARRALFGAGRGPRSLEELLGADVSVPAVASSP